MKKRYIFIFILITIVIAIIIFLIFFNTKTSKNLKIGNNSTSQEIVDYILNISSYKAKIEIEIDSNKNKNKYIIKQEYKSPDMSSQEVLEPSNIKGVRITKNGNHLKLENTNLNLSSVFENYEYISDNNLDLSTFIKDYKSGEKTNWQEENNQIIMSISKDGKEKALYIDVTTKKPSKLEIKDINKLAMIYISYNEVEVK